MTTSNNKADIFTDDFSVEDLTLDEKADAIIGGLQELNEKFEELLEKLADLGTARYDGYAN